jgi:bacillithiol biosynthesis deacetylase BshB1
MKVLAFGIHPDDVELGCGGTVALCASQGHEVTIVDLTRGESSSNGTPEERAREAQEAARVLGCSERANLGLPDAGLVGENPDQQRAVVEALRRYRPDVVLTPSSDDPHPDHASGGVLIERALYLAGIHGYRTGGRPVERWVGRAALVYPGRRDLEPDLIVDVSEVHETKMSAIRAHRSQFEAGAKYTDTPLNRPGFLESVEARALWNGHRIGVRFGEPFRSLGMIGIKDLSVLLR